MPLTRRGALGLTAELLLVACHRGSTVVPGDGPSPQRHRALRAYEAQTAFAHLYGYVRFFHATDAASSADWRKLAAQGVAYVAAANTLGELTDALDDVFRPLAPQLQLWVSPEPEPPRPKPPRASEGLVYWQYQGYPGSIVALHKPPYYKVRVTNEPQGRPRYGPTPAPSTTIEGELTADLHARLPVVLSNVGAARAAEGMSFEGLDFELGARALTPDGWEDEPVRVGTVVEIWNVLRHFYPYQAEVRVPWDKALYRAVAAASKASSIEEAVDAVRGLVHMLQDGHGYVGHPRLPRQRALPFRMEVVENEAVVTATEAPDRFPLGAIVQSIGGEKALDRIRALEGKLSGSRHWRRFRAAAWESTAGPAHTKTKVTIEDDAGRRTTAGEFERNHPLVPARPEPIAVFDDGVFYVDLTRAQWSDIRERIEEIAVAPGVVFDMRGYPNETHRILDHLMTESEDIEWMQVPRYLEPGGHAVGWFPIGWHLRPETPHIYGHRAFLVSPAAISYSESVLSYVEAYGLGTLVGEAPSAGANGDIVRVDSLAGFFVVFSGMRVTRHDGRRFHVQGVAPQVKVQRTIEGLRQGRDEVLDGALQLVRDKIALSPVVIPEPVVEDPTVPDV
jgi:hypothetical protein